MVAPTPGTGARAAVRDAGAQIRQVVGQWGEFELGEGEVTRFATEFGEKRVNKITDLVRAGEPANILNWIDSACDCYTDTPVALGDSCDGSGEVFTVGEWKYVDGKCVFEYRCRNAHRCESCDVTQIGEYATLATNACSAAYGSKDDPNTDDDEGINVCAKHPEIVYSSTVKWAGKTGGCVIEADCYKVDPDTATCTGEFLGTARTNHVGDGSCEADSTDWSYERFENTRDACPPPKDLREPPVNVKGVSNAQQTKNDDDEQCPSLGEWEPGLPDRGPATTNGCVNNRSYSPVKVWMTKSLTRTLAPGRSTCNEDPGNDVDHVQDLTGHWWKIGPQQATVTDLGVTFSKGRLWGCGGGVEVTQCGARPAGALCEAIYQRLHPK